MLRVTSVESGRRRRGFQLTALAGDAMAGRFEPADGRTRVLSDTALARDYLEQTAAGTMATASGAGWTFTWNPPLSDVGVVTFFACGDAADGDGRPDGDFIECATFQLN